LNARFGHGEVKAQRAFDGDLQVAEVAVVEDFAGQHALVLVALFLAVRLDIGLDIGDAQALVVLEVAVNASQRVDMVGLETAVFGFAFAELLAFVAQAFFHFPGEVAGVDQLHLAFALVAFAVGDDPDIGGDAGVVEQLVGQADHGLQPVVFDDPAADIAFAAAGVAGKQRRAVEYHGNARAFARLAAFVFAGYALAEHVLEKQQGAIVDARQAGAEAAVEAELVVLLGDVILLGLPFHAEGRVGQHVVEGFVGVAVAVHHAFLAAPGAEGVAEDDLMGVLTLDHQVRAADGEGFGVVFLAVELDMGARVFREDVLFRFRQHAAGAAGGVVNADHLAFGVNVLLAVEQQVDHQLDHFTRGEVVPGFLVGLLVEAPHQVFEDVTHGHIGYAAGMQVD